MKKNILVTGGAGFIGHHLVKELIKDKENRVFVIDNLSFGKKEYLENDKKRISLVEISLLERKEIRNIIKFIKPLYVFHLGALHYIPYCIENPEETFNVNVMGTHILLDELLNHLPRFIFFASTAAVYKPDNKKHSEDKSVIEPIDIYGKTKLIGEMLFQKYYLLTKVSTTIGRFFNVYGPEETNPHLIPSILAQVKSNKKIIKIGNLFPKRDYIYVEDVVNAILLSSRKITNGFHLFNIGTGKSYSVKEIIEIVKIYFPYIRFIQQKNLKRKNEREDLCANIEKIKKEIGWKPKYDFDRGFKKLIFAEGF